MLLIGSQFIGSATSRLGAEAFSALNAATGETLPTDFFVATKEEVDAACDSAQQAFSAFKSTSNEARAHFLELIADGIEALGDVLIERCSAETALPTIRLEGERGRTCNQLRMFAKVIREGSWRDVRIEPALPDREPIPRPDLRRMLIPMGPVAVFGASNFPLAFSVAGGDTASALAVGCPVVVKAHPAHPGTSEMVARAIIKAAVCAGMPDGVFSMVQGHVEAGEWLVQNQFIQAVGFTGSQHAGRALCNLADKRPSPIPVFAEMGSVNPVFILPGALAERGNR
ncbi:MAG: aldehyde dehydrogenase family protein [Fimbriimonadaceae bacterium]